MTLAPWRSVLAGAIHRNRSLIYSRYIQLATVRTDGRPANRTVVFRGFLEDSNQLKFITDLRSEKVEQIKQVPWGEVCWYFPNTREQFRLFGRLTLVCHDENDPLLSRARIAQWNQLSEAARSQFTWADPGQRRPDKPNSSDPTLNLHSPVAKRSEETPTREALPTNPQFPLPNFCLVLLAPEQVDHLQLRDPQSRTRYVQKEEDWEKRSINP